jgi:hypothetical protein
MLLCMTWSEKGASSVRRLLFFKVVGYMEAIDKFLPAGKLCS